MPVELDSSQSMLTVIGLTHVASVKSDSVSAGGWCVLLSFWLVVAKLLRLNRLDPTGVSTMTHSRSGARELQ